MAPTRSRRIATRRTRSRASTPDPEVDADEDSTSTQPPPSPPPPQPSRRSARRTRSTTPTATATTTRRQRNNATASEESKTEDTKTEDTEVGKVATRKSRRKAAEEKDDTGTKKTPARRSRRAASANESAKDSKKVKKQQKSGILDYFRRKSDEDISDKETGDTQEDTGDSDGDQDKKLNTPLHDEDNEDDEDKEQESSGGTKSSSENEETDEDSVHKDSSKEDTSDAQQDETDETNEVGATTKPQHEPPDDEIEKDANGGEEENSDTSPGSVKDSTPKNATKSTTKSTTKGKDTTASPSKEVTSKKQTEKVPEESKSIRKKTKEIGKRAESKSVQSDDANSDLNDSETLSKEAERNQPLASPSSKSPDPTNKTKKAIASTGKVEGESHDKSFANKDKKASAQEGIKNPLTQSNVFFGGTRIGTGLSVANVKQKVEAKIASAKLASAKLQDPPLNIPGSDSKNTVSSKEVCKVDDNDENGKDRPESKEGEQVIPSKHTKQTQDSNTPKNASILESTESHTVFNDEVPNRRSEKSSVNTIVASNSPNILRDSGASSQGEDSDKAPKLLSEKTQAERDKSISTEDNVQDSSVPLTTKIRKSFLDLHADDKEKNVEPHSEKTETDQIIQNTKDLDPDPPPKTSTVEAKELIHFTKESKTETSKGEIIVGKTESVQLVSSDNSTELKGKPIDAIPSLKSPEEIINTASKDDNSLSDVKRQASARDTKTETVLKMPENSSEGKSEDSVTTERSKKDQLGTDTPNIRENDFNDETNKSSEALSTATKLQSTILERKSKQSKEDALSRKDKESGQSTAENSIQDPLKSNQEATLGGKQEQSASTEYKPDNAVDIPLKTDNVTSGEEKSLNKMEEEHSNIKVSDEKMKSAKTDQEKTILDDNSGSLTKKPATPAKSATRLDKMPSNEAEKPPEVEASIKMETEQVYTKLGGKQSKDGHGKPSADGKMTKSALEDDKMRVEAIEEHEKVDSQLSKPDIKEGESLVESELAKDVEVNEDAKDDKAASEAPPIAASSSKEIGEQKTGDAEGKKRTFTELSTHESSNSTPGLVEDATEGATGKKLKGTETIQTRDKLSALDNSAESASEKEGPMHTLLKNGMKENKSDESSSTPGMATTSIVQDMPAKTEPLGAPDQLERDSIPDLRIPKVSIDQIKARLYIVGYKTHYGKGAEKLFANYWDALCNFLGVSTKDRNAANHSCILNGSRKAIRKFLTTKKLKRLHNMLILGLLNRADCTTAIADDVFAHIPPRWRKRVKIIESKSLKPSEASVVTDDDSLFATSIESNYKPNSVTWTASGVPENYSTLSDDTKLSLCLEKTPVLSSNSSPLPGALSMDPLIRSMAEKEGLKVSENAIWLIMVGMREYVKSLMKNTISCMNSINEANELPEVSELIQAIGPVSKDRVTTFKGGDFSQPLTTTTTGKRKCISALDLTSYLMLSTVTCGRNPSNRNSFDQCFMSAFNSVLMSSQSDFESFKDSIVSGIDIKSTKKQKTEKADRDPIFSPPENMKKEMGSQDRVKTQEKNGGSVAESKPAAQSNARRQTAMRGMGRGAKNLSALKARAAAAARAASSSDLTKLNKPSTATNSDKEPPSAKSKSKESNPVEENRPEKSSPPLESPIITEAAAAVTNKQATTSETKITSNASTSTDQQEERPKEATNAARRVGRGFGVKNLRAMMMKSKSNVEENPTVEERKEDALTTSANLVKNSDQGEPGTKAKTTVEAAKSNIDQSKVQNLATGNTGSESAEIDKVKNAGVDEVQPQKSESERSKVETTKVEDSEARVQPEKSELPDESRSVVNKTELDEPGHKLDATSIGETSLDKKEEPIKKVVGEISDVKKEEEKATSHNESNFGNQVEKLAVEVSGVEEDVNLSHVEKTEEKSSVAPDGTSTEKNNEKADDKDVSTEKVDAKSKLTDDNVVDVKNKLLDKDKVNQITDAKNIDQKTNVTLVKDIQNNDQKASVDIVDAEKVEEKQVDNNIKVETSEQVFIQKDHVTKLEVEKSENNAEVGKSDANISEVAISQHHSTEEVAEVKNSEVISEDQPAIGSSKSPDTTSDKSNLAKVNSADIPTGELSAAKTDEKPSSSEPTEKGYKNQEVEVGEKAGSEEVKVTEKEAGAEVKVMEKEGSAEVKQTS